DPGDKGLNVGPTSASAVAVSKSGYSIVDDSPTDVKTAGGFLAMAAGLNNLILRGAAGSGGRG
ncbi:MAG: hypothetical protein KC476_08870, partial [Cyanobacteria bacterium HKST-UBA06]|nr:hypothetical protein [Cyanobacteria bacterium HKST-UBA06]